MSIYKPYTYLIGWTKLNKWYYGVRFAKSKYCLYETGCHPDDFWITYFTSSKIVKSFRDQYGEPDVIQIRKTFDCPIKAQVWEMNVLSRLDVLHNDMWLNESICGNFMMNDNIKSKISKSNKKPKSDDHKINISKSRKGMKFSDEHRENIRKATTGISQSPESKLKKSNAIKNLKWYNNGVVNKRSNIPLGDGWTLGRLKGFKWSKYQS